MTDYSSHDAINEDLKDRLFDIDMHFQPELTSFREDDGVPGF